MLKFSTFLAALLLACVLGANAQNISVNPMNVCSGSSSTVSYTGSAADAYSWDFGMGASPATAMTEGPHNVMWSSPGMKTITMNATTMGMGSTSFSANPNAAIPDNGCGSGNGVMSSIAVSGITNPLSASAAANMSVTVNIPHTWVGDVVIFLEAPNGTFLVLHSDPTVGNSGDNFTNTVFTDAAGTSITAGTPPYTGMFRPLGGANLRCNVSGTTVDNFAGFTGINPNGNWRIHVFDDDAIIVGTLVDWTISFPNSTTTTYTQVFNVGAPPVALNTGNPTSTSVNLFWQPVAGVSQWRIGYRVAGANMWNYTPNVTASMSGGNLFRTVNGLQTGSMYEFVVMPAGSDCMSNMVTGSTSPQGAQTCRSMTDVYVNVEGNSAALYWEVDGGMNNCAIVQYGPRMNSITTWTMETVQGGMTPYDGMYLLSGLQPGVEYGFRVMNNCTACSPTLGTRSAWSAIYYFTPMGGGPRDFAANTTTSNSFETLSVYPNPNKGAFSLRYEAETAGENNLQVLDMNGRVVVNETIAFEAGLNEIPVDITAKTAGIYFVKFGTKTVKVVVQ